MSRRWIVMALAAGLTGCGSDPQLSASTADALHKDVAKARTGAENHDPDAAVAALADVEKRIDAAEQDGEISKDAAAALRRGAARARRRAAREIAPLQPEATATPVPTPAATPPPGPGKGKGKAKGHGEDKGAQGGEE